MRKFLIVVGVVGGLAMVRSFIPKEWKDRSSNQSVAVSTVDDKKAERAIELKRLEPDQDKRNKLLGKLMADGSVVAGLEYNGSIGYLTVGPAYQASDYDAKKTIADLAFAWCRCEELKANADCDVVIIQDRANHKRIGKYDRWGFKMN